MEWIDEIKKAMAMLKNGCSKNDMWAKCEDCPFGEYCEALELHYMPIPEEWDIED